MRSLAHDPAQLGPDAFGLGELLAHLGREQLCVVLAELLPERLVLRRVGDLHAPESGGRRRVVSKRLGETRRRGRA